MADTKDNIVNIDFGTAEPNVKEVNEQEETLKHQFVEMLLNIGQSTYEYAMYTTKDEYIKHMEELYDSLHPNETKGD